MTISDIKIYFPPDILNALTDDNEDNLADNSVLQRYIDDAWPVISSINPDLNVTDDANLIRSLTAKYVIKELYARFGLMESATAAHAQFIDLLKRATGISSQSIEENPVAEIYVSSGDQVFTVDELDKW